MTLKIRSESTGETREIKTSLLWVSRPSWAPDGRSLFVVGSDGKNTLAIFQVQVDSGLTTFLVDSEPGANIKFIAPAWDGKSVFYTYFEFAKKRSRVTGHRPGHARVPRALPAGRPAGHHGIERLSRREGADLRNAGAG
ncbi:MAG: hypothetical protein M0C28_13740 [Candidatus Moduliflexus flocculans]|nr:hypothetical protein [Candidatus Moduliflexus flocculans]